MGEQTPARARISLAPISAAGVGIPSPPDRGAAAWVPGVWVMRHYRRAWLRHDVVAGLVLTAVLVPAGMGYAEASGLPAITGLYATIIPLIAYAIFGPSRIMVLGPDSGLVALVAAAVVGGSANDPAHAIAHGALLAIMVGLLCIAAGLAKAGFLTDLLSKPVRVGYMNGIALVVLVTQTPKLCGFSVKATGVADGGFLLVKGLLDGKLNVHALAIGLGCLIVMLGLRALWPKAPGVLVAVTLATIAVTLLDLGRKVSVVGAVPRGIPLPSIPDLDPADLGRLSVAAVGVALVSFADTSVLSRTFAGRHGYRVDPNRELIGLGMANLAGGFFQGFPVSSSSSRTPVAESAGSKTQLTGVVGALAILVLLVAAPWLLQNLPTAALGAVVISAALRLFDFKSVATFRRVRWSDFMLSLIAFLAVGIVEFVMLDSENKG